MAAVTARQLTVSMLVLVSVLYAVASFGYWWAGRPSMAIVFVGYVAANVGLILDAL